MVFALFIRASFSLRDDLPEKTVCVCVNLILNQSYFLALFIAELKNCLERGAQQQG